MLGTKIVAAGGATNSGVIGDTEGYDVSTNAWSELTPDPNPQDGSCYGALSGQLYLAGGTITGGPLNITESFSATTNKWTAQAAMPQAVMFTGSTVANGLLYCFGGSNINTGRGTIYNNVQIYQP